MDVSRPKTRDPDEWLEYAPDFSRPMAAQLREWIVRWEPDLSEAVKWNMLCFAGRKLVCGISACQRHVGLAFFRGVELLDPAGLFHGGEANTSMRALRLTTLDTLDDHALRRLLHAAVELDTEPFFRPAPKVKREPWPMPEFFAAALKNNRRAGQGFAALSSSCQREYLIWVSTAKREETRARRLTETLAALAGGYKWIDRKKGTPS